MQGLSYESSCSVRQKEALMKRSYEKPVLTKRDQLAAITAGNNNKVSEFFDNEHDVN